jgi:uncharacterized protein (DUF1330 family)
MFEPHLQEFVMKALVLASETIHDDTMFGSYRQQVPATVAAFGGKFLARGGTLTTLEGAWPNPRLVIIEFPSREAAEGWYNSADYQEIIGLRQESSTGSLIIIDAVD